MTVPPPKPTRNEQETAVLALEWLTRTDDLLSVFLGTTGLSVGDLREQIETPELLAAVLDFLLLDDAWIERFCRETGLPPEAPMAARSGLPGGDVTHWT